MTRLCKSEAPPALSRSVLNETALNFSGQLPLSTLPNKVGFPFHLGGFRYILDSAVWWGAKTPRRRQLYGESVSVEGSKPFEHTYTHARTHARPHQTLLSCRLPSNRSPGVAKSRGEILKPTFFLFSANTILKEINNVLDVYLHASGMKRLQTRRVSEIRE